MPLADVEVVRQVYEALKRRDYAAAAKYLHPEGDVFPGVIGLDPPGGGSGRRLHGREQLQRFLQDLGDTWEAVTVEFEELVAAPDGRVLAVERWCTRGRDGIEVDTRIIDVHAVQESLVVRVDGYLDRAEALKQSASRMREATAPSRMIARCQGA